MGRYKTGFYFSTFCRELFVDNISTAVSGRALSIPSPSTATVRKAQFVPVSVGTAGWLHDGHGHIVLRT